ncbi:MAG TPA: HD domain-containing protein [Pseudomonas sp.]|nr:HD domain-containing protein [Pseudomonas sp.]
MRTPAFARLHDIAFLGALDYTQRLYLPRAARSRAAHSLGVAALANHIALARGYSAELRRHLLAAALLHDIGHPPLSHSAEAALRQRLGYDHHAAGERLIRGERRLGHALHRLLARQLDVAFLLDLLAGRVGREAGGDLFASRFNLDTLDAIARSLECLEPGHPAPDRLAGAAAAFLAADDATTPLDAFWRAKDRVYAEHLGRPPALLADLACRWFFRADADGAALGEADFFATETAWQARFPELFAGLAQLRRGELPLWLAGAVGETTRRRYLVAAERAPAQRYLRSERPQHLSAEALLAAGPADAAADLPADYAVFLQRYPHLQRARRHSTQVLQALRAELAATLASSPQRDALCVVVGGSYGREEACPASDMDYFILLDGCTTAQIGDEKEAIHRGIAGRVAKESGDSGIFGAEAVHEFTRLVEHIGGSQDSTCALTRRMLLLLEGQCLYGAALFERLRRQLLEAYLARGNREKAISRFLLNDVIRYYRTIAIDFQHKASVDGKAWGLRSIKLKFSRKLLYFTAIAAIAETARPLAQQERIARLLALLERPALQRIQLIASAAPASAALAAKTRELFAIYEFFLARIAEPANRRALEGVCEASREDSPLYMALRRSSKAFSVALYDWLRERYPADHPIHNALLF